AEPVPGVHRAVQPAPGHQAPRLEARQGQPLRPAGCLPWVESTVSRLSRGARALPRVAEEQPTNSRLYPVGATTRLRPGPGPACCG
ncbi:hypothetical protein DQE80_16140, partial [Enterococcus sp. HPCN18]